MKRRMIAIAVAAGLMTAALAGVALAQENQTQASTKAGVVAVAETISAANKRERGASFTVRLPV